MNAAHRWLCRSQWWRSAVEERLLPWALNGVQLGENVLEIGPGPGITTDILRKRAQALTCIEVDADLAASLQRRMAGLNVTVLHENATRMSLPDASVDTALCFTMLHHVPSVQLQDRLLAEVARVLRPGGVFAGTDSVYSRGFAMLHLFDTMVVVDPQTFPVRLKRAGFGAVEIEVKQGSFRFRARLDCTLDKPQSLYC